MRVASHFFGDGPLRWEGFILFVRVLLEDVPKAKCAVGKSKVKTNPSERVNGWIQSSALLPDWYAEPWDLDQSATDG
jgi:hypothetical protein